MSGIFFYFTGKMAGTQPHLDVPSIIYTPL